MNSDLSWRDLLERKELLTVTKQMIQNDNSILGELYPVLSQAAQREGFPEKDLLLLFLIICDYLGGMMIYFPKGRNLRKVIKRYAVCAEFNGKNAKELSRKYGISLPAVYRYLKDGRELKDSVRTETQKYRDHLPFSPESKE
ncbi:Mor transcription activator family protein [Vibrio quintilis]|uniref:Mor transcription activator family protein n=1 Tax=Vibrio quintilis TaxID=1117707 RepID=A0A1M7YQX8_9VIBR|nr:Mor transcription activator family protein [Vibrio quintilis]SHO55018.1 Mor transcription activator family protein [Vibrio quintilis]